MRVFGFQLRAVSVDHQNSVAQSSAQNRLVYHGGNWMHGQGGGSGIIAHFSKLEDPRIDRKKLHKLLDIIVIAVCSVISGAESWEDMELYGEAKFEWL